MREAEEEEPFGLSPMWEGSKSGREAYTESGKDYLDMITVKIDLGQRK